MAETLHNRLLSGHSTGSSATLSSPASRSLALSFSSGPLPSLKWSSIISEEAVKLWTKYCWRGPPRTQAQVQDESAVAANDGLKWWEKNLGVPVRDIHSAEELTEAIAAAEGKLVIVEFYATWCGSCRALFPKLCKLAAEHPGMVFVKINFDANKALCKSLNVKFLPYFHFYRGSSEQLESFSCSITKLQKLKDAIAKYEGGGQGQLADAEASSNLAVDTSGAP